MSVLFGKVQIVVDGETILNKKKSKGQKARELQKLNKEALEKKKK